MITFDYILLAIIVIIALLGFKKGFIESLGSVLGIVVAALLASRFYPLLADRFGGSNMWNVIAFVIIFGLAVKIVGLAFWVIGKIFRIVTVLPFVSSFDRLLGLLLGLVEGIFVMAVILSFALKYPISEWVIWQMSNSVVAKTLLSIGNIFVPLFPEAVQKIKSFL